MNKIFLLLLFIFLSLPSFSQKRSGYQKGSYYDMDSVEHKGYIYERDFNEQRYIIFKETLEMKAEKVKAKKISGYVVAQDSFIVKYGFAIDQAGYLKNVSVGFLEVIEPGKLSLYKYHSSSGGGMPGGVPGMGASVGVYISRPDYLENYLLMENDSDELIPVIEKKKHFINQMSEFFGGYPEIVEMIESEEWGYEDMPEIVKFCNSYSEGGSVKKDGF